MPHVMMPAGTVGAPLTRAAILRAGPAGMAARTEQHGAPDDPGKPERCRAGKVRRNGQRGDALVGVRVPVFGVQDPRPTHPSGPVAQPKYPEGERMRGHSSERHQLRGPTLGRATRRGRGDTHAPEGHQPAHPCHPARTWTQRGHNQRMRRRWFGGSMASEGYERSATLRDGCLGRSGRVSRADHRTAQNSARRERRRRGPGLDGSCRANVGGPRRALFPVRDEAAPRIGSGALRLLAWLPVRAPSEGSGALANRSALPISTASGKLRANHPATMLTAISQPAILMSVPAVAQW